MGPLEQEVRAGSGLAVMVLVQDVMVQDLEVTGPAQVGMEPGLVDMEARLVLVPEVLGPSELELVPVESVVDWEVLVVV